MTNAAARLLVLFQGETLEGHPGYHAGFQRRQAEGALADYRALPYYGVARERGWPALWDEAERQVCAADATAVFLQFFHGPIPDSTRGIASLRACPSRPTSFTSMGDPFGTWLKPVPASFRIASRWADVSFLTSMGRLAQELTRAVSKNLVLTPWLLPGPLRRATGHHRLPAGLRRGHDWQPDVQPLAHRLRELVRGLERLAGVKAYAAVWRALRTLLKRLGGPARVAGRDSVRLPTPGHPPRARPGRRLSGLAERLLHVGSRVHRAGCWHSFRGLLGSRHGVFFPAWHRVVAWKNPGSDGGTGGATSGTTAGRTPPSRCRRSAGNSDAPHPVSPLPTDARHRRPISRAKAGRPAGRTLDLALPALPAGRPAPGAPRSGQLAGLNPAGGGLCPDSGTLLGPAG